MRSEWEKEKYDKAEEDPEEASDTSGEASEIPEGATGGGKKGADLEKELLSKGGKFPTLSKPFG
jgi:hypothetical protein